MMKEFFGQFVALGAAGIFSITSMMFSLAGRKYNALQITSIYLPIALIGLATLHYISNGEFWPAQATGEQWLIFGISGVLGYGFGMIFIINAFERVGPRIALLVTSINPILSALFAWLFADQTLVVKSILGVIVTLSGIAWVISDRRESGQHTAFQAGVIFAALSALSQAIGFIFSNQGLADGFDPLSAAVLRITIALIIMWPLLIIHQYRKGNLPPMTIKSRFFGYVVIGTIAGPIIGAVLVLTALQEIKVGIATTLFNTSPIFLLPIGYFVFKDHITHRAIIGTVIAVIGIGLFFI